MTDHESSSSFRDAAKCLCGELELSAYPVRSVCSFDRQQNRAFQALLTAFAEKHPEKVTLPFTESGFTLELQAGHWTRAQTPVPNQEQLGLEVL